MAKIDKSPVEESNQTELIQFRCSTAIKGKIQKLSEKEGMKVSEYVRGLAIKKVTASERSVTASERSVTPTSTVTGAQEPRWDKKAIQELFMILGTILGLILIFKIVTRW